jgi:Haem-binding domain
VKEGKAHLNFSEFTKRRIAVQNHKLEEITEMVKEKEMPLPSYTYLGLHPEANLTDEQRATITLWAQSQMAMLAAKYPADSLVLRRR